MSQKKQRILTHLLTLFGLLLMLAGGVMWGMRYRTKAALAQQGHVVLAVTASGEQVAGFDADRDKATRSTPLISPSPTEPTPTPPPPTPQPLATSTQDAARATTEPTKRVSATVEATEHIPPTISSSATPSPTIPPTIEPTATHSATPNPFPPALLVPSRIVAQAIGLDSAVVEMGWQVWQDNNGNPYSEWMVPDFAAGWHKNSMLPAHGGNTVLSAHNNTAGEIFHNLADLEIGHTIQLQSGGLRYTYAVEEKYIVKEEDESWDVQQENNDFIEQTTDERLTLLSCWPYDSNSHRVVVVARPLLEGVE